LSFIERRFAQGANIAPDELLPSRQLAVQIPNPAFPFPDRSIAFAGEGQPVDNHGSLVAFIGICTSEVVVMNAAMQLIAANDAWSSHAKALGQLIDDRGRVSLDFLSADSAVVRRIKDAVASSIAGITADALIEYGVGRGSAQRYFQVRVASFTLHSGRAIAVFNRDVSDIHTLIADKRVLADQLVQSEDKVRRRIAREMHDSTVQDLVAIGLNLKRLRHLDDDPVAQEVLTDIKEILLRTQRDVRTLSYLLHPPLLDDGGVSVAMDALVRGLANRMETRVRFDSALPDVRYPIDIEMALYRVAQEALVNVHRHASAGDAVVRLSCEGGRLILEIEDNGVGLSEPDGRKINSGVGIQGMRARIQQLEGSFSISSVDGGTLVRAIVPLEMAA
jgi:signal transduction histidine kinase